MNDAMAQRAALRFLERVYGLIRDGYRSPWVQDIYPWSQRRPTDGIDIEWDELTMEEGIMPQLAPLGVPRIYSSKRTRRGERMIRKGAGIFIDAEFFTNPEGRAKWEKQIAQIAAVSLKTAEYDVANAILTSHMDQPKRSYQLGFDEESHESAYMNFVKSDIETSFYVNKTVGRDGLVNLTTRYLALMGMFNDGASPDMWILPPNMKRFYTLNNTDITSYQTGGPPALQTHNPGSYIPDGNGNFKTFMDLRVVDTQMARSTTQSRFEAGDLFQTYRSYGEIYPMQAYDYLADPTDFVGYKTKDRNVLIHNENTDKFSCIMFREALRNCLRFTPDGLNDHHDTMLSAAASGMDFKDIFLFDDGGVPKVARYFAEIDPEFLPEDQLLSVAYSLKGKKTGGTAFGDVGEVHNYLGTNTADFKQDYGTFAHTHKAVYDDILAKYADEDLHVMTALLELKLSQAVMDKLCNKNAYIPFNVMLCRPWMTYVMSTAVLLKAGAETGRMFIGNQDFTVGMYAMNKSMAGSYTMYTKAVTMEHRNIILAEDVFCQRYVRGGGTIFVDDNDVNNHIKVNGDTRNGRGSLLAFLVPANFDITENWIQDIRGYNSQLKTLDNGQEMQLFPTADYYNSYLQIHDDRVHDPTAHEKDYETKMYKANTLCALGHYETGPKHSFKRSGMSALGPYTYPGVGKTRNAFNYAPLKEMSGSKSI